MHGTLVPDFVCDLPQECAKSVDFAQPRHAGQKNPEITFSRGAKDCPKLGAKDFGVREGVVHATVEQ